MGNAQSAAFSSNPRRGCAPLLVSFTDQTAGSVTSYLWDLGNSVTATNSTPSTTYSAPGIYIVQLTTSGSGGTVTTTDTITVYDKPAATFTGVNLSGCVPLGTQFTSTVTANAPGPVQYSWDFGDGMIDTVANPLHHYQTPGNFTVSLTVRNSVGCTHTVVQNAYVNAWQLPQLSFTANSPYNCGSPSTVSFSSGVSGGLGPYTYAWDFGDNGSGTGPAPSHSYTGGTYHVQGIVTDSRGCKDTTRIPNYIFVLGAVPSFTTYNVCEDSPTIFINTTGTQDTATWDFGDNGVDTTNQAIHTYLQPGTFTVRMTVKIGNCIKQVTRQITIYPKAVPTILKNPDVPCPAPQTLVYTASTDIPVSFYKWSFARDGTIYHTPSVTKHYPVSVEDLVILEVHTANGCVSQTEVPGLYIQEIHQRLTTMDPTTQFEYQNIRGNCVGLPTHFGRIYLTGDYPKSAAPVNRVYPSHIASYRWDFGDGGTSTLQYPIHTYATPGIFTIRTIITTDNGCVDTAYSDIEIVSKVKPALDLSKDSICYREPVTFYNLTANPPPGVKYLWYARNFSLEQTSFVDSFSLRIPLDTAAYMTLSTEYKNCRDTTTMRRPLVVKPPVSAIGYDIDCWPSLKVTFQNMSKGADTHLWDLGDGTTSTARDLVHIYAAPGTYAIRYTTSNNISGCRDTFKIAPGALILERYTQPFNAPITTSCPNIRLPFYVVDKGPKMQTRFVKWIFEGDTSDNWMDWNDVHAHWFQNPGIHDVILMYMYSSKLCIDTTHMRQLINIPRPIPDFRANVLPGCAPLVVLFEDSSKNHVPWIPNDGYFWDFGDKDSVNTKAGSIYHTYANPGRYTIKLRVNDSMQCVDSLIRDAYFVIYGTEAVFDSASKGSGPDSACLGEPVQFRSASRGVTRLTHIWDFGDGTTDTGYAPTHIYTQRGRFPLRMIAIDSIGCRDTIDRILPINISKPAPAFTLSSSLSICPPLQIKITNSTTEANSYSWDFGEGNQSPVVVTNPITTYLNPGKFRITLVATDAAGCRDSTFDTVRVLGYNGALSFDPPSGCLPLNVTFRSAVPGIPLLTWDFGDGYTDTSTNSAPEAHVYTRAGAFLPKVIFSDGQGCNSLSAALDSVYVDEVTADFSWSVPCADTPFSLTSLSKATYNSPGQLSWTSPSAVTPSAGNPGSMTFTIPGTYPITLIATNAAGCADTITKDVVINALPLVSAGTDTAICPGDTARLFASGAVDYTWAISTRSTGAWLGCTTCDSSLGWLNQQQQAVYTLSGRDANGCYGRDSVTVRIQIKTTSTSGPGGAICYGQSYRLSAAGADTYQWLPAASIDSPNAASPLATPKTSTTYVVISQEGTCQVDTQRIPVTVYGLPDFSAGPDKIIALGAAATLEPRGTYKTIRWLGNDSTLSCLDCPRPNATPHYTRTYWATVTDENGCESTDSVTVHVRCNGSYVFIPNTFTPNGDGQNDWFYPQGSGLEGMRAMRIFNRWGQLVFESMNVPLNSATAGWDGRFKGEALAPDTYFYVMSSRCSTGEVVEFKGDVTLVR